MPKVDTRDWESYDEDNFIGYEKIRKSTKKEEKKDEKSKNDSKKSNFSKKWYIFIYNMRNDYEFLW